MKELLSAADIDLSRHAVIEASAGTGKTYTIEQLVVRILCAPPELRAPIDRILVVTFTEKAAGEMRERIRLRIEKALASETDPSTVSALRAALDGFDGAAISTIHGFCQRVLQQYAFENRQPFALEACADGPLCERLLREIQRSAWPRELGEDLPASLELAGYPDTDATGASAWERRVLDVAARYQPPDDGLLPEPGRGAGVAELAAAVREAVAVLMQRSGLDADLRGFLDRYRTVMKAKSAVERDLISPLTALTRICTAGGSDGAVAVAALGLAPQPGEQASRAKHGGQWLIEAAKKGWESSCPELPAIAGAVDRVRDACPQALRQQLASNTIARLKSELDAYKREHGLLSFQDMLTWVDEALADPSRPYLLRALRERYRYAIVDEFQDTDSVQWRIFSRVFVEAEPCGAGVPPAENPLTPTLSPQAGRGSNNRLIVVGDPKQAIYAFRGADVYAYIAARKHLTDSAGAEGLSLPVNRRSRPELVEALNTLFEGSEWFPADEGIAYPTVRTPDENELRCKVARDDTGRAALTILDLEGIGKAREARAAYAEFVADEIGRLLGGQPLVMFEDGAEVPLAAGHICVLTRTFPEANVYVSVLGERGIPHSVYKRQGLWQSEEATHLAHLLRVLAWPGDRGALRKALLTRFFGVPVEDLRAADELPDDSPILALIGRWAEWADRRDWARLFQSLLEDTGLLLREIEEPDGERRVTNWKHITQTLEQLAYREGLDLLRILQALDERRARLSQADEENRFRIETELPKVRIMTMHAAKGLEFAVVFVGGGFTKSRGDDWCKFHDGDQRVYDLTGNPEHRASAELEEASENRRLLYVAMTRAAHKLYVPRWETRFSPGPVATILFEALDTALPDSSPPLWERLSRRERPGERETETGGETGAFPGRGVTPGQPHPRSPAVPATIPSPLAERGNGPEHREGPGGEVVPARAATGSAPPTDLDFRARRLRLHSFTSLYHGAAADIEAAPEREEAEPPSVVDVSMARALPPGIATGTLVHEALQAVNCAAVTSFPSPDALAAEGRFRLLADALIAEHLPAASDARATREALAALVWAALRTPLGQLGGPLGAVADGDRLTELEFYCPVTGDVSRDLPDITAVADAGGPMLHGFIDLVARVGERHFIVDWKTNMLPAYDSETLLADMRRNRYVEQYELYSLALARWLARRYGERFDPSRRLGGVYYLYVRGLNGRDDASGVFYAAPPTPDELSRLLADAELRGGQQ